MKSTLRGSFALIVVAALGLGGCIDRGFDVIAENDTDQEVLARSSHDVDYGKLPLVGTDQRVVRLPPNARVLIAEYPFTGGGPNLVEILDRDCAVLGHFSPAADGGLVVIESGLVISVRREFPEGGGTAEEIDACHTPGPSLVAESAAPASH